MNKLLKEFLSYILIEERVTHKVGDTWKTPRGTWTAKRADRTQGGFASQEAAKAWLSGTGKASGDDTETDQKPSTEPDLGSDIVRFKGPERYMGVGNQTEPKPDKELLDKYKTLPSGVNVYDTPIITPDGNKIVADISPEATKELLDKVRQEIDRKVAPDDSVPEMSTEELETYRARGIEGPDGTPESDEQFRKRMKTAKVQLVTPPRTIPDDVKETMRKAGVPERHIQLLERTMNVIRQGEKPPLSLIINGSVGAGTNQSQTGEVLTLALLAVPPSERERVINALTTPKPKKGQPKPPETILNNSWVTSAAAQAQAYTSMMDRKYGSGNWSVETTAWDTPGDISGVGLTQETKGFSTDGVVRIKVNGESRVVRLSMKKDGDVYLLNGAANEVTTYALQTLTPEERTRHDEISRARRLLATGSGTEKVGARQKLRDLGIEGKTDKALLVAATTELKTMEDTAISKLPEGTQRAIRTIQDYPTKQQQSAVRLGQSVTSSTKPKPKELSSAVELAAQAEVDRKANPWSDGDRKFAEESHRRLSGLKCNGQCTEADMRVALQTPPPEGGIVGGDADKFRKAMLFAAKVEAQRGTPDEKKKKQVELDKHRQITNDAKQAYIQSFIGSPDDPSGESSNAMLSGLMLSLEEKFPLSVIASGTESMVIGGVPLDSDTCLELFKTNDPQKIQMTLVERDGQTYLIAKVGEGDGIPLAVIDVRERGEGYRGSMTVGYQLAPEFECQAASANAAIIERKRKEDPSFKTDTTANDAIVAKCGKKGIRG